MKPSADEALSDLADSDITLTYKRPSGMLAGWPSGLVRQRAVLDELVSEGLAYAEAIDHQTWIYSITDAGLEQYERN